MTFKQNTKMMCEGGHYKKGGKVKKMQFGGLAGPESKLGSKLTEIQNAFKPTSEREEILRNNQLKIQQNIDKEKQSFGGTDSKMGAGLTNIANTIKKKRGGSVKRKK
jgi:hypothetical protein